jgi:hypothetical protein
MTTLYRPSAPVKSTRRFGAGILDATPPAPLAAPAGRPWEVGVRAALASLGYAPCDADAGVFWVESRGRVDACPVVRRGDWAAVNAAVVLPAAPADADADVEAPPARPRRFYEPTLEERSEWAAECDRVDRERARGARRRSLGMILPDLAGVLARTSLAGHDA